MSECRPEPCIFLPLPPKVSRSRIVTEFIPFVFMGRQGDLRPCFSIEKGL